MANRNFPNDYYAWYNDDSRLAILSKTTTSDTTTSRELYDTFQGTGDLSGTITNMTIDGTTVTVTCSEAHGLTHSSPQDRIAITGTRHYDGNYAVESIPSPTTFTITSSAIASNADSVNALAVSSGTATATTAANHGYLVGDKVFINADNNTYDEEVTVASTNGTNQFTYSTSKADNGTVGAATVGDTGTFTSLFVDNGLRYTYRAKYTAITAQNQDLKTTSGLDSGLHHMVLCYVKARLFEDAGDIERASYYRRMFESGVHKYPLRKSGVRALSVPRI